MKPNHEPASLELLGLMKCLAVVCLLLVFSCTHKNKYPIEVPQQTRITSEWILSELEEKAKSDLDNDWILNQQLYFCEQMEWPLRCEQVLNRAKGRFGLTETLIDQYVSYHLKHGNFEPLAAILKGAIETRSRLEASVLIGLNQSTPDVSVLEKYMDRFNDDRARLLAISGYLAVADTAMAVEVIEEMLVSHPADKRLLTHYSLFASQGKIEQAIALVEKLLLSEPQNTQYRFDLGLYYYQTGQRNAANSLLRGIQTDESNAQLHQWMKANNQPDSALFYLNKMADISTDRLLLLSKAELLESTGRLSSALPIYETVLGMDSTDSELRERVEIVRRKVAYLRQKWEKKDNPPSPTIKRKTLGN